MDTSEEFRAIEFCAGYGGICLGIKRAVPNLRVVAVSEIEAFAVANLVSKMEEGLLDPAPIWPDLKTFPNKEFHNRVDLLVAGFPCQPFSAAGKRGGDTDPRHLFPFIKQSIVEMQPRRVFLENVEGIISSKLGGDGWNDPAGTSVLLHVLRELERVGYRATAGVFSAAEVGAPHQRKRVFILADRRGARLHECVNEPGAQQEAVGSLQREDSTGDGHPWPSRPGEQQHCWEPPRVVVDPKSKRTNREAGESCGEVGGSREPLPRESQRSDSRETTGQTQPPMGRDADGLTDRLDQAELYSTCDNRTDELRLLGNGVVPDTAERAWRILNLRLRGDQ